MSFAQFLWNFQALFTFVMDKLLKFYGFAEGFQSYMGLMLGVYFP